MQKCLFKRRRAVWCDAQNRAKAAILQGLPLKAHR
jgi:hypothetical protein